MNAIEAARIYNQGVEEGKRQAAPAAQHQCKWPTCQSEEYQQALAEQINQELVTGAAQPAPVQGPVAQSLKDAVFTVLEGFNIPHDVRKILESAYYNAPPAAQRQWVPMTQELLNNQHPWLYEPMWIALKDGSVLTGIYEWRQGRHPDRLLLDGAGNVWAFEAAYVMPVLQPEHPDKEKQA